MKLISFLLYIIVRIIYILNDAYSQCHGQYRTECCDGYYWSIPNESCLKCPSGFHGTGCSNTCRYPAFGESCQKTCECEKKDCNPVVGCITNKKCSPGTFGTDCTYTCRYPAYGYNCQMTCQCDRNFCEPENGCKEQTSVQSVATYTQMVKNNFTESINDSLDYLILRTIIPVSIGVMLASTVFGILLGRKIKCQHHSQTDLKPPNEFEREGTSANLLESNLNSSRKTIEEGYLSVIPDSDSSSPETSWKEKLEMHGHPGIHGEHLYADIESQSSDNLPMSPINEPENIECFYEEEYTFKNPTVESISSRNHYLMKNKMQTCSLIQEGNDNLADVELPYIIVLPDKE